jgi:hypothetical protein
MSRPTLSVRRIERRLATGDIEGLDLRPGVNVLVGRPNTGKTKWLQTLDFLLGDPDDNPYEGGEESGLSEKYDAAAAELLIGDQKVRIERRWREPGSKGKVFVGDEGMPAREFQRWLSARLGIPLLHFPKGNPMSGQTWPELTFRMLLRHIYRQQRFWSDIADKQPEGEQHACVMQFLGLAEHLFTDEYGRLVELKMKSDRLRARREQYGQTLEELARELISEPGATIGVSAATVDAADQRITEEVDALRQRRVAAIAQGRDRAVPAGQQSRATELGQQRAHTLVLLEDLQRKAEASAERLTELLRYRAELIEETDRLSRAADAGAVLADLNVTHCPACDQPVLAGATRDDECFLCHRPLPERSLPANLGTVRLQFERERLAAELQEAGELVDVVRRDEARLAREIAAARESLRTIENELAPARQAVGALVQEEVSAIDMALGQASERQRQIGRLRTALATGERITDEIAVVEKEIEPIQKKVNEANRSLDMDAAAAQLEDGMNAYLTAINQLRKGVWSHSQVRISATRSTLKFRVGSRGWDAVLGGTDTLYFLMAYHYGLLSLADKAAFHYPGLSIIDVPGEFSGEAVEDKENFIVQPFVNLLGRSGFNGAQVIMTGASFTGLKGVHRLQLRHVFTA